MAQKEKLDKKEIEVALNTLKASKEEQGIIAKDNKVIVIDGNDFTGMTLARTKGVVKEGVYYSCKAGTKWEDIDSFCKKNIAFNLSDFNN